MAAWLPLEISAKHLKIGKLSLCQRAREGWGFLGWTEPVAGDAVAACEVQRSLRPEEFLSYAGMAIERGVTLTNEQRGKGWERGVLAVNNAGEGELVFHGKHYMRRKRANGT